MGRFPVSIYGNLKRRTNSKNESYSKKLKQVKSLPKGYDVTCGNITVKLGLSAHNKLQKQILEEFVPNFASGSELLYIGDTSDRTLQRDDKRLSELKS